MPIAINIGHENRSSLKFKKAVFGYLGGFFSGLGEYLVVNNQLVGLPSARLQFIQLALHNLQLTTENYCADNSGNSNNSSKYDHQNFRSRHGILPLTSIALFIAGF